MTTSRAASLFLVAGAAGYATVWDEADATLVPARPGFFARMRRFFA